jgi:glycosyltransferase involved in cell wall biosynthesis
VKRLNILHVISGLGVGGAESSLLRLVTGLTARGIGNAVISLTPSGDLVDDFARADVTVTQLDMRRRPMRSVRQLRGLITRRAPDLVHGWMYHGNLLASLCSGGVPVIWSIRHSLDAPAADKLSTRALIRLGGLPLWHPRCVLFNSETGHINHVAIGYSRYPTQVIRNGVDCDQFRPGADVRAARRTALQFVGDDFVIGLVGRWHPAKDVATFLRAAARAAAQSARLKFVLVGRGLDEGNPAVARLLAELGIGARVRLLGVQRTIASIYPAFDLLALSSVTEATPNVLLEAMACGVPCVGTDVGDVAAVIGATDRLVAPGDHAALARLFLRELDRAKRGHVDQAAIRERTCRDFGAAIVIDRHIAVYRSALIQ